MDTLSTRLEGRVYDPEDDDLLGWFKDRKRDYKPLKGSVSMREYCRIIAGLLPDHTWHHVKIRKSAGSLAATEKVLIAAQAGLEEAAKAAEIRGQVWWVTQAEHAKAKRKEGEGVHAVGEEQPS